MPRYEIALPVKVHGWDHEVTVEVEADDRWEATNALSAALTKLVAAETAGDKEDHSENDE